MPKSSAKSNNIISKGKYNNSKGFRGYNKMADTTNIKRGTSCSCGCHGETDFKDKKNTYCKECQQNHQDVWLTNTSGVHSWLKRLDLCCYPDQNGAPCHLKIRHVGFHATRDGHYSLDGMFFEKHLGIEVRHNDCQICSQKKKQKDE